MGKIGPLWGGSNRGFSQVLAARYLGECFWRKPADTQSLVELAFDTSPRITFKEILERRPRELGDSPFEFLLRAWNGFTDAAKDNPDNRQTADTATILEALVQALVASSPTREGPQHEAEAGAKAIKSLRVAGRRFLHANAIWPSSLDRKGAVKAMLNQVEGALRGDAEEGFTMPVFVGDWEPYANAIGLAVNLAQWIQSPTQEPCFVVGDLICKTTLDAVREQFRNKHRTLTQASTPEAAKIIVRGVLLALDVPTTEVNNLLSAHEPARKNPERVAQRKEKRKEKRKAKREGT